MASPTAPGRPAYARGVGEIVRRRTEDLPTEVIDAVRSLCDRAFDDFADTDFDHALGGWHVVVTDGDVVLAHAAIVERIIRVGERDLRTGYVEAVATDPDHQGQGIGTSVMAEIDAIARRAFELGALSTDRTAFYGRLGWEVWRGPTFVLSDEGRQRTEDEDGGIMVLRFGPSAAVDLDAPIACRSRPGDDW